ncbi:hypothetical protein HOO34_01875 [Aliarcobacter cryaerophilus]|uniref:S-layer protein n=1 Tax=Aliarcobacter cryaerophilus TaxID=28198 RepID=A0A7G9LPG0_9BACT|nr:hypothetical protein [Aliarcobacter cryaerophilus]QNM90509.1 hypothetical protein HOO34_01875 [Aliarcobacter cryaerophilus]
MTTGVDTITGTDANDLVTGVTSSLSSEKTLTSADIIDGDAGTDTLQVSMKANFTGFTGDGKMENVENVELTNDSTIGRIFDATGITGVEKYVVDAKGGDVELKDLNAAGITVDYSGAKASAVKVAFDADFVAEAGTADEMTLKVADLGTAAVAATDTTAAVAAKYAAVTMADIETVNVESAGTANLLDLTAVINAKTINVSGAADLTIGSTTAGNGVNTTVTKVDASAATGSVTADLTNSGVLTSVATGSGDDSVIVDTNAVLANAEIVGGAGEDKLTLINTTGAADTVQFSMSGIETIVVNDDIAADITFSALNVSDVNTIEAAAGLTDTFKYVNASATDLTINGKGAQATGTIETDNSGTTVLNLSAAAADVKAKTATTNDLTVTASETADLTVNVGSYVNSSSVITANKATAVVLNVASGKNSTSEVTKFNGTIDAAKAESITVNATGNLGVTGAATINAAAALSGVITTTTANNVLALDAAAMETLEITAAKGLAFTGSDLTAVQTLNATTGDALTLTALNAAANVTIAGSATASAATIVSVGSSTTDYSTTVTAEGLKGGFQISGTTTVANGADITIDVSSMTGDVDLTGAITAGGATTNGGTVTIEASDLSGDMNIGAALVGKNVIVNAANSLGTVSNSGAAVEISAFSSVVYNGTNLAANDADISMATDSTVFTAELNGGLENDTFDLVSADTDQTSITVTGDLGMGTNAVTLTNTAVVSTEDLTVDFSGIVGAGTTTTTINIAAATGDNTIIGSDYADTIITGTASDTVTGGKGADDITITGTATVVTIANGDTGLTTATADVITGFTSTTDDLKLGTAGSATNFAALNAAGSAATVEEVLAAVNTAGTLDGTVKYVFAFDGTTPETSGFLVIDYNADGTADGVVELVGLVDTGDMVFGDIIA